MRYLLLFALLFADCVDNYKEDCLIVYTKTVVVNNSEYKFCYYIVDDKTFHGYNLYSNRDLEVGSPYIAR